MFLCDNPKCRAHCEVAQDQDGNWRFKTGFQTLVDKSYQFKPDDKIHLCPTCQAAAELVRNVAGDDVNAIIGQHEETPTTGSEV